MALREFTGPEGDRWQVWLVRPTTSYTPMIRPAERRLRNEPAPGAERRISATDTRMPGINPQLEQGWLCFQSESQKRRLLPVPDDWSNCPDEKLRQYLDAAKKVHRQLTESPLSTSVNATRRD